LLLDVCVAILVLSGYQDDFQGAFAESDLKLENNKSVSV
jgi:hypothetical protein